MDIFLWFVGLVVVGAIVYYLLTSSGDVVNTDVTNEAGRVPNLGDTDEEYGKEYSIKERAPEPQDESRGEKKERYVDQLGSIDEEYANDLEVSDQYGSSSYGGRARHSSDEKMTSTPIMSLGEMARRGLDSVEDLGESIPAGGFIDEEGYSPETRLDDSHHYDEEYAQENAVNYHQVEEDSTPILVDHAGMSGNITPGALPLLNDEDEVGSNIDEDEAGQPTGAEGTLLERETYMKTGDVRRETDQDVRVRKGRAREDDRL